ncbi:MAG TPA: hypothetical protein VG965_04310 [Patescibacteria group bacterium]|nr:hypothetical protein [Patescibacteria group bacterium]
MTPTQIDRSTMIKAVIVSWIAFGVTFIISLPLMLFFMWILICGDRPCPQSALIAYLSLIPIAVRAFIATVIGFIFVNNKYRDRVSKKTFIQLFLWILIPYLLIYLILILVFKQTWEPLWSLLNIFGIKM